MDYSWPTITSKELSSALQSSSLRKILVIDSRSFLEYNSCHILGAVNVCCSKLIKKRLSQDKVHIRDLLAHACEIDIDYHEDVIVYDQCSASVEELSPDCFVFVLLTKLSRAFASVSLLQGGFLGFQARYGYLCRASPDVYNGNSKLPSLTSLSQPCLSVSNSGPTKILPFLFLGSEKDVLTEGCLEGNDISYVLNISTTCTKPNFIQDSHFLRIPINDNHSDRLEPFFLKAFNFIDKVKEANGSVLVHCLAGISRSPTVAIAYLMYHQGLSADEAYRYVKDKRPTISPNFNFLGQLLEFEDFLKKRPKSLALRLEMDNWKDCFSVTDASMPCAQLHNIQFFPCFTAESTISMVDSKAESTTSHKNLSYSTSEVTVMQESSQIKTRDAEYDSSGKVAPHKMTLKFQGDDT